MKQRELISDGIKRLEQANVPEAIVDAKLLWLHVSGQSDADYLLAMQDDAEKTAEHAYMELIKKRADRIPLQHLTGHQNFMGFEFLVTNDVLIPRFDTEVLVEQADFRLREMQNGYDKLADAASCGQTEHIWRVLDLCCGSGCIGLSLARLHPDLQVDLSDISDAALRLTKENARRLQTDVNVIKSNLFDKIENKYDMIVSNPPYIEEAAIDSLMPEVRDHEPHLALDGGQDGLNFYRTIVKQAGRYLNENGWLLFEIGDHQAYDVQQFLVDAGFSDVRTVKDLADRDRIVMGRKKPLQKANDL